MIDSPSGSTTNVEVEHYTVALTTWAIERQPLGVRRIADDDDAADWKASRYVVCFLNAE